MECTPAAETFTHTDSELLKTDTKHNRDAGSTASTAILVGDRLVVANVGDSRAVICRGGDGKIAHFVSYFSILDEAQSIVKNIDMPHFGQFGFLGTHNLFV